MNPPLSHPHVLPTGKKRPAIALIIPNTLTALGLAGLLTRMVPHAEIAIFHDFREAEAETERGKAFFHYFTTAPVLLNHAAFFLRHQQKTIVLVHGDDVRHLPQGFHPVQVLFMGAAVVRQQIHPAQPWVPDGSPLQKLPEIPGQVLAGVIPCEVNSLCPHPVQ